VNNGYYPYSMGIANKQFSRDLDPVSQMGKYKEEEKLQKAPTLLPYDLETVKQSLGNAFVALTQVRASLKIAEGNNEVNYGAIDSIKNKIDEINKLILDIPEDLAKISI
jgi:hypothetical protein